ncbi:MAG: hypothetical protein M0002_12680 [Rhodospirillales bacterium]|nr:hypothetical protein [Rhodospirillales bacterium]
MSADDLVNVLYRDRPQQALARDGVRRPLDWRGAAVVWLVSSLFLLAFQAYLQNVNIATSNGLWQSVELRPWVERPSWAHFDAANALYYPVYGFLCRMLGELGVLPGRLWQQMAELNAVSGGLGLAAVYLFVMAWLRRRSVAVLTVLLYGGSAFYLLLSVIDEYDIVPDVFVLAATLMACAWFARPRVAQIAVVAIVFSIGWLFGWHFLFPSLPPLLLALFLATGTPVQRVARPALFLLFMSILPLALAAIYFSTSGKPLPSAVAFLIRLFWVGKGVGTGWGGFAAAKFPLAGGGMAESLIGGMNLGYGEWATSPMVARQILAGAILGIGLLGISLRYAWRNRTVPPVVTSAVVLGGTLVTGIVFNLYSQPQDPEMVISVMVWTVAAWALVAQAVLRPGITARPIRGRSAWVRRCAPVILAASLIPFAYNISALAAYRGGDPEFAGAASRLSRRFDLRRTVFLYHGFEGIITWQFALEDGSWTPPSQLPPAPSRRATFKLIAAAGIPVNHPRWSPERQAGYLRDQIDAALARHYEVVAGGGFLAPDAAWVDSFLTVASPAVPQAMRRMFDRNFKLTPAYHDPYLGEYELVTRRSRP